MNSITLSIIGFTFFINHYHCKPNNFPSIQNGPAFQAHKKANKGIIKFAIENYVGKVDGYPKDVEEYKNQLVEAYGADEFENLGLGGVFDESGVDEVSETQDELNSSMSELSTTDLICTS